MSYLKRREEVTIPNWPLASTTTPAPVTAALAIPAMKALVWLLLSPIRMVLASAKAPPRVPDVNVVTAGTQAGPGIVPNGYVVEVIAGEGSEGTRADGDVAAADVVSGEGIKTAGDVVVAACVGVEGIQANGRVDAARGVAAERRKS